VDSNATFILTEEQPIKIIAHYTTPEDGILPGGRLQKKLRIITKC
jgi:hypothetical protein